MDNNVPNQQNIYTTYDSKSGIYEVPFYSLNNAMAMRSIENHLRTCKENNPNNQLLQYPEDFTVFLLGSYDQHTGKIESLDTPMSIFKINEILTALNNSE